MSRFERVGNNLAVDFANTVYSSKGQGGSIRSTDDLLAFLAEAAPIGTHEMRAYRADLRDNAAERERIVSEALALRAAVRSALDAIERRRRIPAESLDRINAALALCRGSERLVRERSGVKLRFEPERTDAETMLVPIAHAAADVLANHESLLRRCASPDYIRYFFDDSRTKRRRWCSMAICGNRAKAAAFAARRLDAAHA